MIIYRGYEIINEKGHICINKNGKFVSTADTINEAKEDIDTLENVTDIDNEYI